MQASTPLVKLIRNIPAPNHKTFRMHLNLQKTLHSDSFSAVFKGPWPSHFARNPVPLQSEQCTEPWPMQITHVVFRDGTSQRILSPSIKNPVPLHHLHSTYPFASHEEQHTGLGCFEISQACSIRFTNCHEFSCALSDESTTTALIRPTLLFIIAFLGFLLW